MNKVDELEKRIADLEAKMATIQDFKDNFSNREIINHKVQFKREVYNAAGTKVIN